MIQNIRMDTIYDDAPIKPKKKKELVEDIKEDSTFNEIDYGLNINDSVVYLHGDIMLGNLFDLISKVRIILANRPEENAQDPINLMINSNGGDVYEALGMIDYIESLSVPVNIIARGRAMSAAAMILACGTGKRIASKLTTIMLHEASAEIFGKSADIKANADHIDGLENDFYTMMAEKTNQTEEFWRKSCRKDFYISAARAKELGVIDEVI
jgi:ATP-dependent Clp endopeptidase proteolytic subunit ClpP